MAPFGYTVLAPAQIQFYAAGEMHGEVRRAVKNRLRN